MFAETFALLYLGHLIADYPLQTDHQAKCKASKGVVGWRANAAHASTHVVTCGLLLAVGATLLNWHLTPAAAILAVAWIGVTHSIIDRRWPITWWMRIARQSHWAENGGAAHVDQTAHITAIAIAAMAISIP